MSKESAETNGMSQIGTNDPAPRYATTRSQLTLVGAGLYRHQNGSYHACKYVKNKPRWKALGTSDRKTAERLQREWLSKLAETNAELSKTTLGTLIETYLDGRTGKSAKTQQDDEWVRDIITTTWEHGLNIRVSDIRASMLDSWLAKRSNYKNSSYNKLSGFWKGVFRVAVKDRIIARDDNPFNDVETPWKNPKKTAKRRAIPTVEQFKAIVESIRNESQNFFAEESANFIEFEGLAGLGQAEVGPLTWSRIDWAKGKFDAWRAKTRTWFPVPIYPELRPLLEKLYNAAHTNGNPPSADARIFKIKDARKALTNACKRLGYPSFTQREMRSFHIMKLHRAGVDIKRIAKWQGHTDGGVLLMRTYTEVFCDDDAAYDAMQLAKLS